MAHGYTFAQIADPKAHGLKECSHCNGYGSSLKETADTCTVCGGSGVVPDPQAQTQTKEALCESHVNPV